MFNPINRVFDFSEMGDFLSIATDGLTAKQKRGVNAHELINVPCAFDIEATSFYKDADGKCYGYKDMMAIGRKMIKCATMYVWQFGIDGYTILGRTWEQFLELCDNLVECLGLSPKRRLLVYVHNLSYEFQFMRRLFQWEEVFAIDERKPLRACTADGIEFRCAYLLSGYSLADVGARLQKYHVAKLVGNMDYGLLRHSRTPLTAKEVAYCVNDVRILMAYIKELMEQCGNIAKIPLTKTAFVRNYCRKRTLTTRNKAGKVVTDYNYRGLMRTLYIGDLAEYMTLKRAFQGGYVHANGEWQNTTLPDIGSYDFNSSYPYVMVAEQYPMSNAVKLIPKSKFQFMLYMSRYCCIFDIEFHNLNAKRMQEQPIKTHDCFIKDDVAENEGRVISARNLALTITDVDFKIISDFYTWESYKVGQMYCYKRAYLPTDYVKCVVDLYDKKTRLKGVAGKETDYMMAKSMLNSTYGMCVTSPIRDEHIYTEEHHGQWIERQLELEERKEMLFQYNISRSRFLSYAWGVFVTAYARLNLFTAIAAVGDDYVYSDTDCVKIMHPENHRAYFDAYNKYARQKLMAACAYHKIDPALIEPTTLNGDKKLLGAWENDGNYMAFKTLGAKRYLTMDGDYNLSLTVSGVGKADGARYLKDKFGTLAAFDAFTDNLDIPPLYSGKHLHTYIDYGVECDMTDYTGQTAHVSERSAMHLEPCGYTLSVSIMMLQHLRGVQFMD